MRLNNKTHTTGSADSAHCPYLRIGVTTRCNYDCRYCPSVPTDSPPSVVRAATCTSRPSSPEDPDQVLTDEDITTIIRAATCATAGVRKVRLAGGEPTQRPGLDRLVAAISRIDPISHVCMTTNGTTLGDHIHDLIRAGLNSLNLRVWSLMPNRYEALTGGGSLSVALAGLDAAQAAGLTDVHVTVPVVRGENDDEIESFVNLAVWRSITVRFMEHDTPLAVGAPGAVTAQEIQDRILSQHTLETISQPALGGPARVYSVDRGAGRVEISTCLSRPPCWRCNRLDVSHDGFLRACPLRPFVIDLKPLLEHRDASSLLEQAFEDALWEKKQVRPFTQNRGLSDAGPATREPVHEVKPPIVTRLDRTPVGGP